MRETIFQQESRDLRTAGLSLVSIRCEQTKKLAKYFKISIEFIDLKMEHAKQMEKFGIPIILHFPLVYPEITQKGENTVKIGYIDCVNSLKYFTRYTHMHKLLFLPDSDIPVMKR